MKLTPKQQFIRFLKDNNAYGQYILNFNKREESRNKAYPKSQFFSKSEPFNFMNKAFTWCNTIEGWGYWNTLSRKWIIYTRKNTL